MRYTYRYQSFFWPAVLILAGVIALLANTGRISSDRLVLLFDLWPVILIVIGLEIVIRRMWHGAQADLAGGLIALVAIVGSVGYVALAPNAGTHTLDTSATMSSGLAKASLEIDVAAATINMSGASLEDKLYTAHIEYSGQRPTATESSGAVTISQAENHNVPIFRSEKFTLDVRLNTSVPWNITINSAATTDKLNFGGVHVASVSLNTAASHDDLTLGPPSGVVPVTFNGAAMTVSVHRPSGTPVSIVVDGAGITLNADGQHKSAVGEITYQTPDFAGAQDAYKVEINGAACTVTLDKTSAGLD
jgi:hypothetical protein